MIGGTKVWLST